MLKRNRTIVVLTIVFRASPGTFVNFGAWPEVGGGFEVVAEEGFPEGLAEPPLRVV